MICPYRWITNRDEEDVQGSSWESEPEGEKPEELASLEAPDDEGEWCWPRRNRITRWDKRMDPWPSCHHLAENDEEEQASGGLEPFGPTKRLRSSVDVEESRRRGRLGSGGRSIHRGNGKIQEWDGVQRTSTSGTVVGRSCPSELLRGLCARARGRLQT